LAPRPTSGIPIWSTTATPSTRRVPRRGYHRTEELTDKALEFIKDAKVLAPEKPFLLCYAPGACHAPHHARKEWIDRVRVGSTSL
jgi:arylsulfatase A-like enzyme